MVTHQVTRRKTCFHHLRPPHGLSEIRVQAEYCWCVHTTRLQCSEKKLINYPCTPGPSDIYEKIEGEKNYNTPDSSSGVLSQREVSFIILPCKESGNTIHFPWKFQKYPWSQGLKKFCNEDKMIILLFEFTVIRVCVNSKNLHSKIGTRFIYIYSQ